MVRIHGYLGWVGMRCLLWRVEGNNGKEGVFGLDPSLQASKSAVAGLTDALAANAKLLCYLQSF